MESGSNAVSWCWCRHRGGNNTGGLRGVTLVCPAPTWARQKLSRSAAFAAHIWTPGPKEPTRPQAASHYPYARNLDAIAAHGRPPPPRRPEPRTSSQDRSRGPNPTPSIHEPHQRTPSHTNYMPPAQTPK